MIYIGKMLIRIQPAFDKNPTLLQVFCYFIIHSKVIFISMIGADATCQEDQEKPQIFLCGPFPLLLSTLPLLSDVYLKYLCVLGKTA